MAFKLNDFDILKLVKVLDALFFEVPLLSSWRCEQSEEVGAFHLPCIFPNLRLFMVMCVV